MADWLRRAALQARRIASVCGGALLLAEAGLLDGRRATTHWRLAETLQARFPRVQVENGPIYVQDGPIWTGPDRGRGVAQDLCCVAPAQALQPLPAQPPNRRARSAICSPGSWKTSLTISASIGWPNAWR